MSLFEVSRPIPGRKLGYLFLLILIVILAILGSVLTGTITYQEGSLVLSTASTTILVVAYLLMVFEQQNQTELQEKVIETQRIQTELMEYENRIASTDHSPDVHFRLIDAEGDMLKFQVYNSGEGLSLNVGLEVNYTRIHGDGFTISNDTLFRIIRRNNEPDEIAKSLLGEDQFETIVGPELKPESKDPAVYRRSIGPDDLIADKYDSDSEQKYVDPANIHNNITDNRQLPKTRISPISEERKFESNQILRPQDGVDLTFRILLPNGLENHDTRVPFDKAWANIPNRVRRIEIEFVGYFEDAGGSSYHKKLFTADVDPNNPRYLEKIVEDEITEKTDIYHFLENDFDLKPV